LAILTLVASCGSTGQAEPSSTTVPLPNPAPLEATLEQAQSQRRSVRSFSEEPVELPAIARLLTAAQGITGDAPHLRAIPSAGALHPLELVLVAGEVRGLPAGVYHYRAKHGDLELITAGDRRQELQRAALAQAWVGDAPACLVVTAQYERTTGKYGRRGERYVLMEVGHATQNMVLAATSMGLGTVPVGAFEDDEVKRLLGIPWEPLMIVPVGHPVGP
jgi:SagB-type dehydrogenase family enzyme